MPGLYSDVDGLPAQFSSFKLGAASWSGGPLPPGEQTYNDNTTFNMVGTFADMGGRFSVIRNNGTNQWSQVGSVAVNGSAVVNSVTWDDGAQTVTVPYTVRGAYDPNTIKTLSAFTFWFRNYTEPAEPPDNDEYQVVIRITATGSDTPSGSTAETFRLRYANPDGGGFNPGPVHTPLMDIQVARRAYPTWATTYEWEAHDSSSYTNEIASSFMSDNNTTYDVWIRYRLSAEYGGNGTWTNYGQVSWTDPRLDT